MAALTRKTFKMFGGSGTLSNFGQFGSKQAGLPQTSLDPTVIQQLAAWLSGWSAAISGSDKAPYLQDMNGVMYVFSYMIAYLYQMGTPEWDSGTTYYTNSVVQANSGQLFRSLQDTNVGNAPPSGASNAYWRWVNPPQNLVGASAPTVNVVQKVTTLTAPNGVAGSVVLGDSAITDNGTNVVIALPLKFADNTVQSTAAQPVSAQNDVTASRALNIVYQNTSGKPMFLSLTLNNSGLDSSLYVGASSPPTTLVARSFNYGSVADENLFAIVLPGYYYKATSGTITAWIEWT